MALTLTIGTPSASTPPSFLNYVDFKSIVVQNSVEVAADTMDFTLLIYENEIAPPVEGNEVIFKDASTREFAGIITTINRKFGPVSKSIIYECTCKDYVYFLNRRLVNETYASQAAGQTIKDILTDLSGSSNSDAHYDFFATNVGNIQDGPTLNKITFDKVYPAQAFDQIAQASGFTWYIDFDKKVYFKPVNTAAATQLLDSTLNIDTDITSYNSYEEETTIDDIGTQLIIRNIARKSTTAQVDNFKGSQGTDHNGETNKIFTLSKTPFGFLGVTSVKLNTVAQSLKTEDVDGQINDGTGASNEVFVYASNDKSYVRFASANTVADGDDIEVTYSYTIIDDSEGGINISSVIEMQNRTGGDGIHQFVFSQASGLRIEDDSDLDRIEEIILHRKSVVLIRGSFYSWTKGWIAGQYFLRRWDQVGALDVMYVVSVTKKVLTPADDPTLSDNVIESQIEFANIPHGVSV